MGVVKNIMVRAVADFSDLIAGSRRAGDAIRDMSDRMNSSSRGLAGSLTGIVGKLAALAGIYVGLDFLKDATNDAIQFDARMSTLNERLGQSAVGFQKWADTTGKAMGYSKMQIAQYGNTYSNMLYDAASDQEDLANKTQKLLEVSAILRSKTGLQQEEVSNRIRSAMNMEADGADELGINVRATAVEQSKAFKAMSNGVKAYSDLSSGMQKAIMYQYILDEVTRRYGTTIADNASSRTAVFTASLKDLRLHMGQAFLPVWTTILPALSTLVNWLDVAAQKVAAFMRIMFGYSADDTSTVTDNQTAAFNNQSNAVDGLAAAHDNLKKAKEGGVAGFDQVNTLASPSADTPAATVPTGGVNGGIKPPSTDNKPDDGGANAMFDGVKKFAGQVKGVIEGVKNALDSVSDWFTEHKDIIIASGVAIAAVFVTLFGPGMIAGILVWSASTVAAFIPVIAEAWSAAIAFLAIEWPVLVVIAAIAALAFGITMLVLHWQEVKEWAGKVWDGVVAIWGKVAKWFTDNVTDPFMKTWNTAWGDFKKGVAGAWKTLTDEFGGAAAWVKEKVVDPVVKFFVAMGTGIGTAAVTAWDAVKTAFTAVGTWFKTNVIDIIVDKWDDLKTGVKTAADNAWGAVKTAFGTVTTWFMDNVVTPVKTAFSKITEGMTDGVVSAFKSVYNTVAGYINNVFEVWNAIVGSNPLTKGLKIDYELPKLAKGGITNGPMVAMIGDNPGGQEVVSPLDKLTGLVSTAVLQALAFSQPSGRSTQQGDIVLNIDGRQFARIVKPYMDNANGNSKVMLNRI